MLRGLYHGKVIKFGNQISFSDKKTRRRWKPNVLRKEYYSEILDERISLPIVARVTRTIDKYQGFDNYIVLTSPKYLEGIGMKLKNRMFDKMRSQPDISADDYLNVSPKCWEHLAKVDSEKELAASLKQERDETRLADIIAREQAQMDHRASLRNAQKTGAELPLPPDRPGGARKKRISVKQTFIKKRQDRRNRVMENKKKRASIAHTK